MRITAAAREATRQRIVREAEGLFASRPFADVTTREIASRAGIAAGTLFNYFPSKEALAIEILDDAAQTALAGHAPRRRGDEPLAEDLFSLALAAIHAFEPYRGVVGPVLAAALGPYTAAAPDAASQRVRLRVLEAVHRTITAHHVPFGEDPISAHLFWTLFLGVLAFWAADDSPGQEDTLVLLDQSMGLFANSLPEGSGATEANDEQ